MGLSASDLNEEDIQEYQVSWETRCRLMYIVQVRR